MYRYQLYFLIVVGHFGCVFHGLLKVENEKVEMEVAVKTLKAFNDGGNNKFRKFSWSNMKSGKA